jgi:hypothetical protein
MVLPISYQSGHHIIDMKIVKAEKAMAGAFVCVKCGQSRKLGFLQITFSLISKLGVRDVLS